ncbi:SDR family NAD(P)-dependent oxidoreductase [Sinomicrobium weinanense]|uniref:SDR family NAD(P)-dependent oxidoreductase n=1 Tax=Sinomicrobium weinanense TaxID=2842200 RepID=A0A926JQI7_9FLAO|nr:SDR family NAD(P)-dependent oxidoreductase [Sinomicrobium weinanense]MBC9795630.1 SDR family NAD(P)-dependent oxidoreductase [Sinomicrobium weinanense]MBU3124651.1 SDR family NAD(P)-dependent oxidoreductase [Sinomicrobium weinanense]
MHNQNTFTVITGASQGLGKALAEVCAKLGRNLILVSLPGEHMHSIAEDLMSRYYVHIICYETDLTKAENVSKTVNRIKKYSIDILINNAGTGGTKRFTDASLAYIDDILFLNMRSLVVLTHQLLPILKKQKESYILNISSLAAFSPMPYKTVYPASKAFVYSFSRGLNAELKDSNIHVAVAHPGGMPTNSDTTNRINSHGRFIRSTILSAETTAAICMKKLLQKESIIIPGKMNRFSSILQRLMPVKFQLKILSSKLQHELRQ